MRRHHISGGAKQSIVSYHIAGGIPEELRHHPSDPGRFHGPPWPGGVVYLPSDDVFQKGSAIPGDTDSVYVINI
jgi:hypothetical protein